MEYDFIRSVLRAKEAKESFRKLRILVVYDKFIKVFVFADDFNIIVRIEEEFDLLLTIFEYYPR